MYKICQKNILCLSLVLMLSILSTFCHASRYEIYISELTEKERKELCDRNQKLHPNDSAHVFISSSRDDYYLIKVCYIDDTGNEETIIESATGRLGIEMCINSSVNLNNKNKIAELVHSGIPFQPCIYNRYKGKTAIGNYMIPPHKNEEAEKILHQFPASDPNTFHYKNFYYGFWTEWDIPQSRRLEGLWDNLLKLVGLGMKP